MKIYITGIDGYLGWPLALYLRARGHDVGGCDNWSRRAMVREVGGCSAIPIGWRKHHTQEESMFSDVSRDRETIFHNFKPDTIVHLGQIPSAPYSQIDAEHAALVQRNNIIGNLNLLWAMRETCPDAHLVKLGTMGEYGTPNLDIPEGEFEMEFRGRKDTVTFPRDPGSFYHASKVADTVNVKMACKMWGLRSTDVMQGVVYGTRIDEMNNDPALATRFDFDECFGTAINRFVAQAVAGLPITPYGKGEQKRGFLPLRDSMQCLAIAIENPADAGEYRVWNQLDEVYSVNELAQIVADIADDHDLDAVIQNIPNPRKENEANYYNPDTNKLMALGYVPQCDLYGVVDEMVHDLTPHRDRILAHASAITPKTRWV